MAIKQFLVHQKQMILYSKYNIIIGFGFGDCGKGIFTDYLCSQSPDSLVVRFSGGHQSGHTVVTDKTSHVFSNFGSGTLRGIPTYWSEYCTFEPRGFLKELNILNEKSINPLIYINDNCPVTTPFDIARNRFLEEGNNHGSCGVGFGTTIEREEKHYSLRFLDLFYPDILKEKLRIIKEYYHSKIDIKDFIEYCKIITKCPNIIKVNTLPHFNSYIFEGSQGLLLDQNFGFFPNVTRSNTGCKNASEIVGEYSFDVYLITRAYQTRHGNGFMTNENIPHNILNNPLETNIKNKYQGKFRKSLLDVSLLEYALKRETFISNYKKNLVITCLDHIVNDYRFTYNDRIINCLNENDFINKISNILNIDDVYISRTNNSENIVKK